MSKVLIKVIESCKECHMCFYSDHRKNNVCTKHNFKLIENIEKIPEWCTLPDKNSVYGNTQV